MKNIILVVLLIMSVISFSAMGIDKSRAQHGKWRISEKSLFLFALLGGSVGGTLGMFLFRHKTKHWYFRFGFPALALIQLAACVYLFLFA